MKKIISILLLIAPFILSAQYAVRDEFSNVRQNSTPQLSILDFGVKGDSTDESTRIQAVLDSFAYKLHRRATFYFPPENHVYGVGRPVSGVQQGIRVPAGISLLGANTKVVLLNNAHFFYYTANVKGSSVITSNTTVQDSVLTFSGGVDASIIVNRTCYLRIGQAAYDAAEMDHFGYFKVKAVTSTTVTLDRPVGYALNVSTVTNSNQKRLIALDSIPEHQFIKGFNLVSAGTGAAVAEGGITIQYGRNIQIEDIRTTNTNTGVFTAQFAENITATRITCEGAIRQNNVASFGRGIMSIAECNGINVYDATAKNFAYSGMVIEAKNYNVRITNLHIINNAWDSTRSVFAMLGSTDVEVHGLYIEGYNVGYINSGSLFFGKIKIYGLMIDEATQVKWNENTGVQVYDGYQIKKANGYIATYRRTLRTVSGTFFPNDTRTIQLPRGYYNRVDMFSTTGNTGFNGMYISSDPGGSNFQITSVTAGKTVKGNYGEGLVMGTKLATNNVNNTENKFCAWYASSAMPTGQRWKMFIDMYQPVDSLNTNLGEQDADIDFDFDNYALGKFQLINKNVNDSVGTTNGKWQVGLMDQSFGKTDSTVTEVSGTLQKRPNVVAFNEGQGRTTSYSSMVTYSVPNNGSTVIYDVSADLTTTTGAGTIVTTVVYTNSNNQTATKNFFGDGITNASINGQSDYNIKRIHCYPGTTITVSTVLTGTATYNYSATIQYVRHAIAL